MGKFLAVFFLCTLMLTGVCLAQEEGEDLVNDPAIQQALTYVLFDQSLFEDEDTTMAAWITYAFARMGWIKEHMQMPLENITPEVYQKSFEEELHGRENLIKVWDELKEQDPALQDTYLDEMVIVYKAGYLTEYVWNFTWYDAFVEAPTDERMEEFEVWFYDTIPDHQPKTLAGLVWEVNSDKDGIEG